MILWIIISMNSTRLIGMNTVGTEVTGIVLIDEERRRNIQYRHAPGTAQAEDLEVVHIVIIAHTVGVTTEPTVYILARIRAHAARDELHKRLTRYQRQTQQHRTATEIAYALNERPGLLVDEMVEEAEKTMLPSAAIAKGRGVGKA